MTGGAPVRAGVRPRSRAGVGAGVRTRVGVVTGAVIVRARRAHRTSCGARLPAFPSEADCVFRTLHAVGTSGAQRLPVKAQAKGVCLVVYRTWRTLGGRNGATRTQPIGGTDVRRRAVVVRIAILAG